MLCRVKSFFKTSSFFKKDGVFMKKVITYGTYDLLHVGHINLLKRAKNLGDYLIVALSTDDFNLLKHKSSYHSYDDRKIILESIKYVDEVIPGSYWGQKCLISRGITSIFCNGK